MIIDSAKLQKTIDELGYLLMQGNYALMNSLNEYHANKAAPDFKVNDFVKKWNIDLNRFFMGNILPKLQELLGHNHYYVFHFMNPEVSIISRTGWNIAYNNVYNSYLSYLKALEGIIFRLEDQLSLAIKREIVQQETDQNVRYKITFSEHSRSIKFNGVEVSTPEFDKLGHRLFTYLYQRPDELIKFAEIPKEERITFSKDRRPVQVLSELGFTGAFKKVFFPVCTIDEIKFINPITNRYADENELPLLTIKDLFGRVSQSK